MYRNYLVYMRPIFLWKCGSIVVLEHALYGMKTAYNSFYKCFGDFLIYLGFTQYRADQDLYLSKLDEYFYSDDGQMPSMTPSTREPQKHGARCDRQSFTSHNTPVLYLPARHEVRAGQRLSMPGRQLVTSSYI